MSRIVAAAVAALTILSSAATGAQSYPTKPIRLMMPNAPGSANDTLGRIVAAHLGEALGQQIVIDNRAGAGGIVGMEIGKNGNPDGYTLVAASTAAMSIAPHLYKKLPYDPIKDYEYIGMFAVTPNLLLVNPQQPVKNLKEWLEWTRTRGNQLNMASAGVASQSHLTGVALIVAAGVQSTHVPYKGGGASVASVVSGESHWTITPAPAAMSIVASGRLRALGHSLPERTPLLKDLPSISEIVPGFKYSGWNGLLAPKGTPKPILRTVGAALQKVGNSPELRKQLAQQGAEVVLTEAEQFRKHVADEIRNVAAVVKAAGLKSE
ncbi:MAG: tripartite tricarboxylate transporter substrate binding protein [Burkholderiales bacterium]|nr:tripartite tricarboxylate transporter substrate binding protein [Burkholderiales bacterium]